jgi:hypothetical protein
MNDARETSSKGNQKSFITIDDLAQMAEEFLEGIIRMSGYKHPLSVRKGDSFTKEVIEMTEENKDSVTLKAHSKTYFFDVRKTREGKPYLGITESHLKKDSKESQRSTIFIFPEGAPTFKESFDEMIVRLSSQYLICTGLFGTYT